MMEDPHEYKLKALTPIWTGDSDRREKRLIPTGLLGSIRWWFEVLIRGLGGSACDPVNHPDNKPGPCPVEGKKPSESGHHCAVCELFGCTGWARKFRFDVLDGSGKIKRDQIKKGESFRFRFTPLRPICHEEWALLDLTLRLIAEYGAIGGKTVLKPSDDTNRSNQPHHQDYGLIAIEQRPDDRSVKKETLQRYLASGWRSVDHGDFRWASLENFWCVNGKYLMRQSASASTFNTVLGRNEAKRQGQQLRQEASGAESWLAGSRGESKKVFSFKDPPRTFGFVKPDLLTLNGMKDRLRRAWGNLRDNEFLEGKTILKCLLP
jgi:CRISPR-associated protein Cmr1